MSRLIPLCRKRRLQFIGPLNETTIAKKCKLILVNKWYTSSPLTPAFKRIAGLIASLIERDGN